MIDLEKEMQPMSIAAAEMVNKITAIARVDAVFGQPVQHGNTVIVPCAEVSMGGGMGMGGGPSGKAEQRNLTVGMGGGAGGGATGRPIAIIVMSPEGVRVQPVVDATKVALAFFTAASFMLVQFVLLLRSARAGKGKELSFAKLKKAIER